MSDGRFEALGEGQYRFGGEMTFATASGLWRDSAGMFRSGERRLCLDLGAVERADSAGVALLIECVRSAQAAGKSITFRNIPDNLLAIIRVGGLESLLLPS